MQTKNRFQLNYSASHPEVFQNRDVKAEKILAVLKDYFKSKPMDQMALLDVGASSGLIAGSTSQYFKIAVGIDIDANALQNSGPAYHAIADGTAAPFGDGRFDVVICNHIYEHVHDPQKLMDEIFRLLKPGGICYFAATNRASVIEPHYRLYFLSWLPRPVGRYYLRLRRGGENYFEELLTAPGLRKLAGKFRIRDYTIPIIRNPGLYCATDMIPPGSFLTRLPVWFYKLIYYFIPTYVWILGKEK